MDNSAVSPLEALNAAIQVINPFTKEGIVKEQDVWGKGFPDLPNLNGHASDAVLQAIAQARTSSSSKEKVTSIAITAQQGVGKTHILSRIRHHLQGDGGSLFVYAGVNNYTDLNLVKYQFQQTLADSLSHPGNQGVMQWQEVAAAMANEGFRAINAKAPSLSAQELINRFDKVYTSWLAKKKNLMDKLTQQVLKTKSNTDPYLVRAILWTLSESKAPFVITWLSGKELDQSKAQELGLPANSNKTSQEREAEALNIIQKILNLVSYYSPVTICFDEIDVSANCRDDGLTTPQVIADLVKRLYDTLEQSALSQGIVILTVMLPDTWANQVSLMPGGTPDRISTYTQRKPIDLKYLGGDSMVELATLWLQDFYEARNLIPPHPVYPFEENQLRDYGKKKPTVREALRWCAENFQPQIPKPKLPSEPLERFEFALNRESEANIGDYLENNSLIADALRFGFQTLKGEILEGKTSTGEKLNQLIVEDITEVEPISKNKGWINFKVIGKENNIDFKIGVAILQHTNGRTVGAAMSRLTDYTTYDLTRGCIVRSKDKKFKRQWEAYSQLNQLIQELGGEWAYLKAEEIRPLIDMYALSRKLDIYNFSAEQVIEFSKQRTINNDLLLEILSDPSGQIDQDTIEGEELLDDFFDLVLTENTTEEDDLNDLFG
ncbi:MAG: ATP-binding protein [Symploca sp. SIO2B6]|nr:ATP-binding protein [Symploca sp. SIO2B6]